MVHLIITVTTHPGRAADYAAAFAELAPPVRQEAGCLQFELYRDADDPRFDNERRADTVVISEKWDSIESLQFHTKNSAPLNKFRAAVKDLKLKSSYVLLSPLVA